MAGDTQYGTSLANSRTSANRNIGSVVNRLPPQSYFAVSAIFHYLGPAFAVLLFAHVSVLGVAWLRIASAAVVFAIWRRPWRLLLHGSWSRRRTLIELGIVLAAMNACFYLAIARLPLGTVGAIEFLGQILLAALGARTRRNVVALLLAVAGGALLADVRLAGEPLGFLFAAANGALFMLYVVLGHRIANEPQTTEPTNAGTSDAQTVRGVSGIDRLGASMLVAALVISPVGLGEAAPAFSNPALLFVGIGVGLCSSVIPYVTDQLAMARLPRATSRCCSRCSRHLPRSSASSSCARSLHSPRSLALRL